MLAFLSPTNGLKEVLEVRLVTDAGILTYSSFGQRDKALLPSVVKLLESVIFLRLAQFVIALAAIEVTLSGIVRETIESHDWNVFAPMAVILLDITTFLKDSHAWKAVAPNVVTVFGIIASRKDVHEANALLPIVVKPLGKFIVLKDEFSKNAKFPILVIEAGRDTDSILLQLANR